MGLRALKYSVVVGVMVALLSACGKDDGSVDNSLNDFNAILATSDRASLDGKKVNLDGVPVDSVVGTYVFWAGSRRAGIPMFRKDRLDGTAKEVVRRGDRVRVNGTIRLLEQIAATDPVFQNINAEEKNEMLAAKIFVIADTVQIIK